MQARRHQDQGFTLIELLVALAVASAIAVALGGLLSFSVEAKSRADGAAAIQTSLLELKIAAQLIARALPVTATLSVNGSGGQLTIVATVTESATPPITVLVHLDARQLVLTDARGRSIGPVDLGMFETAQLEFLTVTDGAPHWLNETAAAGQTILAMRIGLEAMRRRWPVLLWASKTAPGS